MKRQEMDPEFEKRKSRQAAFHGLARGFSYPDAQWVESLLSGEWVEAFRGVLEPLGASSKGLEGAIAALPAEPAVALQALQVEYTHLFINAIPHVSVPPYASAYVGQGMLMNEAAEAALRAYRHAGLVLAEDYHDLPDHLAVELEFLSWLEERAIEAYEGRDGERAQVWTEQKETFLSQQVQPWLPEFCRRVEEAARISFYRELAKLVKLFLGNIHEPG